MSWWAWSIGGAILLGSELGLINAQFYLVFVGAAAILTGLLTWSDPALPAWLQWVIFPSLAVLSMLALRGRLYDRLHRHSPRVPIGAAGGELVLPQSLDPGESCRAEHGGSFWTVRNESQAALPAGARVKIAAVRDLTLLVQPH
jgi:membrane protein implicated in regulation of membrane protease activity